MNRNENEKDPGLQDLLHVWKNQSKKSVPSNRKVQAKGKKRVHDNVVSEEKIEPEEEEALLSQFDKVVSEGEDEEKGDTDEDQGKKDLL